MTIQFGIDPNVFTETPTKKLANVILVVEYENPKAYGYPEVCRWEEEYEFDVEEIRRKVNGKN